MASSHEFLCHCLGYFLRGLQSYSNMRISKGERVPALVLHVESQFAWFEAVLNETPCGEGGGGKGISSPSRTLTLTLVMIPFRSVRNTGKMVHPAKGISRRYCARYELHRAANGDKESFLESSYPGMDVFKKERAFQVRTGGGNMDPCW